MYSSKEQLEKIAHYLTAYMKIPYFQDDTIPGKVLEKIISLVHGGKQLPTYDYVDVCIPGKIGWQVKSTKEDTPLTWKRAKIANSEFLIKKSEEIGKTKELGDAIIDFCNHHASQSIKLYNLEEIWYSRLIMFKDNTAIYFERLLCTKDKTNIFDKEDYEWRWSIQKKAIKKEQLSAFHGVNKKTKIKAFAWHGKGENQLHFSAEKNWWPEVEKPSKVGEIRYSKDGHAIAFKLPSESEKVSWDELTSFLNRTI
ncbi:hypothetical protein [Nitrosomonas sp. Is37]|uniref:hypothetical protein n=1 Tax=Nitrosomonas sp. Is37 TaxID=3080535 RepID=UPI00294B7900|nr:hypothetical protein [Nitrosomonas sp. Is37]MDV6344778.1 hypothetical protein [Nitrosomonas sp. Is37]